MNHVGTRTPDNITPLNKVRITLGLSSTEIAKEIGVSSAAVGYWMQGKSAPSKRENVEDLAKLLGVTPEWIIEVTKGNRDDSRKAYNRWENFWSSTRDKAGFSNKEVTDLYNIERVAQNKDKVTTSTVSKYFTGQSMPSDDAIKSLCNIFDVDYETGKAEFIKAYDAWHKTMDVPPKKVSEVTMPEVAESKPVECAESDVDIKSKILNEFKKIESCQKYEDIEKSIYGKVSYYEFKQIVDLLKDSKETDVLALLYGKVNFDLFNKIINIL